MEQHSAQCSHTEIDLFGPGIRYHLLDVAYAYHLVQFCVLHNTLPTLSGFWRPVPVRKPLLFQHFILPFLHPLGTSIALQSTRFS